MQARVRSINTSSVTAIGERRASTHTAIRLKSSRQSQPTDGFKYIYLIVLVTLQIQINNPKYNPALWCVIGQRKKIPSSNDSYRRCTHYHMQYYSGLWNACPIWRSFFWDWELNILFASRAGADSFRWNVKDGGRTLKNLRAGQILDWERVLTDPPPPE